MTNATLKQTQAGHEIIENATGQTVATLGTRFEAYQQAKRMGYASPRSPTRRPGTRPSTSQSASARCKTDPALRRPSENPPQGEPQMRITKPIPGPWLRELRELAGLRQYAVEERSGLPTTAISTLERKADVSPEVAGRIVEAIIALRCRDNAFERKLKEVK
jgi:hypothetical protein